MISEAEAAGAKKDQRGYSSIHEAADISHRDG